MATATVSFDELRRSLANGDYRPIYLLHGEEGYYIDVLVKDFEKILPPDDRDFALSTVYAPQTEAAAVVDLCRQLPMMCERQVVIVKEAQAVNGAWVDKLARYAASPTRSTILVVCGRGKKISAKEFSKAMAAAGGVTFESVPVKDWQIPALTEKYIKDKGLSVDPKALSMLRDFIGTDLSRLYNEIDKLAQILGANAMVTPEAVERNIGVSKEYNNFELVEALAAKDFVKVFKIADYFQANPKHNPLVMTTALIFGFFADLLVAYYTDRTDRGIKEALALKNDFALRRIKGGMAKYNAFQLIDIIAAIRQFDAFSKGGGSRQDPYLLFKELMFRILSTQGPVKKS